MWEDIEESRGWMLVFVLRMCAEPGHLELWTSFLSRTTQARYAAQGSAQGEYLVGKSLINHKEPFVWYKYKGQVEILPLSSENIKY